MSDKYVSDHIQFYFNVTKYVTKISNQIIVFCVSRFREILSVCRVKKKEDNIVFKLIATLCYK